MKKYFIVSYIGSRNGSICYGNHTVETTAVFPTLDHIKQDVYEDCVIDNISITFIKELTQYEYECWIK